MEATAIWGEDFWAMAAGRKHIRWQCGHAYGPVGHASDELCSSWAQNG